jgi:hypothetical protein
LDLTAHTSLSPQNLDLGKYMYVCFIFLFDYDFWCFNATFSSISAISRRPVLVVDEVGVPGEKIG